MKSCVTEINNAVTSTKEQLTKLAEDSGLDKSLPTDWTVNGIETFGDKGLVFKVCEGFVTTLNGAATMYLVSFTFNYIKGLFNIASVLTKVMANVTGAIGGLICGAAAFIITDMIVSAITGAIERKQLNEAIDELKRLRDQVAVPLKSSATKVAATTQNIKDGIYKIDDRYQIIWNAKKEKYTFCSTRRKWCFTPCPRPPDGRCGNAAGRGARHFVAVQKRVERHRPVAE